MIIHGLVDQPLTFTMDDLKRFPSVTRLHFIECAGNRGTVKEGAEVFENAGCISCHGEKGLGGPAPQLQSKKGADVPIWQRERVLPLRAPFATIVWDFINRGMPLGNEGSLTPNEVYSVTAYLLFLNHVIPEDAVLDKDSLPKVKMPIGDDYAPISLRSLLDVASFIRATGASPYNSRSALNWAT